MTIPTVTDRWTSVVTGMTRRGAHTKINTGGLKLIRMNMALRNCFYLMSLCSTGVVRIEENMDPLRCCLYCVVCVKKKLIFLS
jgi:hypothetical protein